MFLIFLFFKKKNGADFNDRPSWNEPFSFQFIPSQQILFTATPPYSVPYTPLPRPGTELMMHPVELRCFGAPRGSEGREGGEEDMSAKPIRFGAGYLRINGPGTGSTTSGHDTIGALTDLTGCSPTTTTTTPQRCRTARRHDLFSFHPPRTRPRWLEAHNLDRCPMHSSSASSQSRRGSSFGP